ncbi:hypothetical protein KSS87_021026 [Heliosperma pusillum]|nr:hypothetical protein KSS87_021026 [Heliosperma pusillum]
MKEKGMKIRNKIYKSFLTHGMNLYQRTQFPATGKHILFLRRWYGKIIISVFV